MALTLPITSRGRSLLLDGLAQSDLDMNHFKILNLDTSNIPATPPTIHPPVNHWLHDWNNVTQVWTATQPAFSHLSGNLSVAQQKAITQLGTISVGVWQGSALTANYVPTLSGLRLPVADLNLNNHKITNLALPTLPGDAVNKQFMDYLLQGLNPKLSCAAASTTDVPLIGIHPVDGVTLIQGNRVLVKNQSAGREHLNGIWRVATDPDGQHWMRADDCNTAEEMVRAYCFVRGGTVNAGTSWVQVNNITNITSDPKSFVQFSEATEGPKGDPGEGVAAGGATGQLLAKNSALDYDTEWVNPPVITDPALQEYALSQTNSIPGFPPAMTTDTVAGRMCGFSFTLIPRSSGRISGTISGSMSNDNPAGGVTARVYMGTGTPPAINAIPTGTPIGSTATANRLSQADTIIPFSISFVLEGLTIDQPVWFDILLTAITTGTAYLTGTTFSGVEIPGTTLPPG